MKWPQALLLVIIINLALSCRESLVKTKDVEPQENREQRLENNKDTLEQNLPKPNSEKAPRKIKKSKALDTLRPRMALSQNNELIST